MRVIRSLCEFDSHGISLGLVKPCFCPWVSHDYGHALQNLWLANHKQQPHASSEGHALWDTQHSDRLHVRLYDEDDVDNDKVNDDDDGVDDTHDKVDDVDDNVDCCQ